MFWFKKNMVIVISISNRKLLLEFNTLKTKKKSKRSLVSILFFTLKNFTYLKLNSFYVYIKCLSYNKNIYQ